jgi:uncharacterized protein
MQPSGSSLPRRNGEPSAPSNRPGSVSLADKVRFLRRPEAYHPPARSVSAIETHMAWVFLSGEYAYKLKKPVHYEFLDFRTLAARRRTCWEEVRLNRRLAPHVYLGVVPLTLEPDGGLALGGSGPVTDWLVRMRRLPSDGMLDRVLAAGTWSPEDLGPAAELLARFYASLSPVPLEPEEYVSRFRRHIEDTERELIRPSFGLPEEDIRRIARGQIQFLDGHTRLLHARVEEGCVVEGHGDLRPDHIYLGPPPAVIDCLEFSRELRIADPADELSFLDLECGRLGSPAAGAFFLRVYRERTGDAPPDLLRSFYRSFRALVRAKLAIWHLRDDHVADPDRWRTRAHRYLVLAREALLRPSP